MGQLYHLLWTLTFTMGISSDSSSIYFAADENDFCQTPDYQSGVCIPLKQCSELYALLLQPRPIPQSDVLFLRQSQCGFQNGGPLVCCATRTPTTTTTTRKPPLTSQVTKVPRPQDVSRHRNIGLINADNCGSSSDDRIVGGNKTGIYEFPWMTLLAYNTRSGKSFRCGGSLISDRYILTAAHCISNTKNLNLVSVRVGEHDTSTAEDCMKTDTSTVCAPPPQDINVEKSFVHPQYSSTKLINDIALLRLASPVVHKANVVPICLPVGKVEQTKSLERTKLLVAGWGATARDVPSSPDLLKVFVPVVAVPECHRIFSTTYKYNINENQLCAGGNDQKQDSCQGDSGGPLMTVGDVRNEPRWTQYGIVSYGHRDCGTQGVPGVYTRVGHYMQWILDTMKP